MPNLPIFNHGQGILVTTHGPGKLNLYSYGPAQAGLVGHYGFVETTRKGVSHFLISHSYYFTKFGFIWQGEGKAECRIGNRPEKHPVGKAWSEASWCVWGNTDVSPLDISPDYFAGAVNRDNEITCFLLPEYLVEAKGSTKH